MPPEAVAVPALPPDHCSFKNMNLQDVLEDLSSRFILNLPDQELHSIERICFQVEQAHWYYEDFVREENRTLPTLHLKRFSELLFRACPMLKQWGHDHELAFTNFMQYKTRVPVCGAIMLNEAMDKCILVKGWKSSSGWGFPKGKINESEEPSDCAVREVLEETGYDLSAKLRREDNIQLTFHEQAVTLFIVTGVPEDTVFQTRTRKEISKIEWFRLADLPTWKRARPAGSSRFYLIIPFITALKEFVTQRKAQPKGHRRRALQQVPDDLYDSYDGTAPSGTVIDNLFARIKPPGTPAPSSSDASSSEHEPGSTESSNSPLTSRSSGSKRDPHLERLMNDLTVSDGRADTPIGPDLQDTPPADLAKKRQKQLALLEAVSEEIAHQTLATPQPPLAQLLPGRPATTSPVRSMHPFHVNPQPPPFARPPMFNGLESNSFPGPNQLGNGYGSNMVPNSFGPALTNGHGFPIHRGPNVLPNGAGSGPILNGHGPVNGHGPLANGFVPSTPMSAGFAPINMGMRGPPISPGFGPSPQGQMFGPRPQPLLAPLQSLALHQVRHGGPVPPLSAGATMPVPQSQQQQQLLAMLNAGRQVPPPMPMPRPSTAAPMPIPVPVNADQVALLSILNSARL